uniref:Integrase n=1 Tax=bacterium enrichment culture clone fosmid MGS-K1 TaxID=1549356 RepID=A0A0B5KNS1_9BACT|nr:integrase [bacterium enrichment culture clone fosmid MGS-K1]
MKTIEQIKEFLEGSDGLEFVAVCADEKKSWVEELLIRFDYLRLKRNEKGVIRKYIQKISGYGRSQTERLIAEYRKEGKIRRIRRKAQRNGFLTKYTSLDIELLANTDEAHKCLSGPATKKILEREWETYGKEEFRNISQISISHLYNLRRSHRYKNVTMEYVKTKPTVSNIGERAKPDPQGKPGYIRIDTVHQGDRDGEKGVYHINAVDEVTQWEIVASAEKISESYLIPVLGEMLNQFPFTIVGFHSDNGSEFVNKVVAELLDKLLIRFTKSRPRHSNDNGLVETKNGSVLRKQLGYAYMPQNSAERLNEFNRDFLNVYINFHRPCFFPVAVVDRKGKVRKTYPYEEVRTPYEKLKSLPKAEDHLRPGVSFQSLDAIAYQMSDNEFAERKVKARFDLFREINKSLERVTSP